jgi:hypothetical protein
MIVVVSWLFTYVVDAYEARHSPKTSATVCNAAAVKHLTVVLSD